MAEEPTKTIKFSSEAKLALSKLPSAEVVTVMEDVLSKVAGVNNSNNNALEAGTLSREELKKKIERLPTKN